MSMCSCRFIYSKYYYMLFFIESICKVYKWHCKLDGTRISLKLQLMGCFYFFSFVHLFKWWETMDRLVTLHACMLYIFWLLDISYSCLLIIYHRTIDEEALEQALSAAVTCTILAAAGPQRSRVLATLYKVYTIFWLVDIKLSKLRYFSITSSKALRFL